MSKSKFNQVVAIVMAVAAILPASVEAQSLDQAYERAVHVSAAGDSLNYRLLRPETVKDGESYPLILFLHGSGERGNDNERQLIHGGQLWLNPVNRLDFPAYVLVPQCPDGQYWSYDNRPETFDPTQMPVQDHPSKIIEQVMQLIDSISAGNPVDRDRIYVMGLSMGGMATFDMAIRYPEVFAAAVPICGAVNTDRLDEARDVKFRIYHGSSDTTVPVECSRSAYRKLRALGADVTYIEFPGVGHGSWYPAFTDAMFIPWLFSQHK